MQGKSPWVSFCISTYKRPEILHKQLLLLSRQTFSDFQVIVSDNDPDGSAREIVNKFDSVQFKYFHNEENLGMIKSFNKSIERSSGEFIVMVTDDDPIENDFLATFYNIYKTYPFYSIYCGFIRKNQQSSAIEFIKKDDFITEILDPDKTQNFLWSSSIIRKSDAFKIGLIPDYGSPHLSDHAFISLVGSVNGGVIMNKMFSTLSSHGSNFSKFNFHYYINGCEGFYSFMLSAVENNQRLPQYKSVISKHLGNWFIASIFALKKYYTLTKKYDAVKNVNDCAKKIMELSFMKKFRFFFFIKNQIFLIKKTVGLLK